MIVIGFSPVALQLPRLDFDVLSELPTAPKIIQTASSFVFVVENCLHNGETSTVGRFAVTITSENTRRVNYLVKALFGNEGER